VEVPILIVFAVVCAVASLALFGSFLTSRASGIAQGLLREDKSGSAKWSAEEWVKVGGAVVGLLASVGTFYTTVKPQMATDIRAVVASRDSARAELKAVRDSVRKLVRFDPHTWESLPRFAPDTLAGDVRVDDRSVSGVCVRKARTALYEATGPARLRCAKGSDLRLHFGDATVVLLMPDSSR
jgi:hypothetical protein